MSEKIIVRSRVQVLACFDDVTQSLQAIKRMKETVSAHELELNKQVVIGLETPGNYEACLHYSHNINGKTKLVLGGYSEDGVSNNITLEKSAILPLVEALLGTISLQFQELDGYVSLEGDSDSKYQVIDYLRRLEYNEKRETNKSAGGVQEQVMGSKESSNFPKEIPQENLKSSRQDCKST